MIRRLLAAGALAGAVAALAAAAVFLLAPGWLFPRWDEASAQLAVLTADQRTAWRDDPALAVAGLGLVAQEDKRLFSRTVAGGVIPVDARSCARAAAVNLKAMAIREGCSTLPMQVAKLAIPEEIRFERSWSRKLLQIRLSLAMTGARPDAVVGAFLHAMPCGADIARGADACALLYFGRRADQLNAAEALLLASAVQAPSRDLRSELHGRRRLALVLNTLWSLGWMSRQDVQAIAELPLRRSGMRPDMVRAASRGYALELTAALGDAVEAARANAERKQGGGDDLLVVGAVYDSQGRLLSFAGGDPSWLDRGFEAGSWVKPYCAQSLLELPGAGAGYLTGTEIPIRLPLRDRNLRAYRPRNVGSDLPERAAPLLYVVKSVNTASLAAMLYAHVYLPAEALEAHLARTLSPSERAKWRTATDRGLSVQLAGAYAGVEFSPADVPDLPGYREMSVSSVRTCLGVMRRHVPNLQVPNEDLSALLGVVRAPLGELGAGMATLLLEPGGGPSPIAGLLRAWSPHGTLAWLTRQLGTPIAGKTATAERNVGLAVALPMVGADGSRQDLLLVLAGVRPSGADIDPLYGGTLAPGVPAFVASLEAELGQRLAQQ